MASEIAKMVAGAKLKQVTGDIEGTTWSLDVSYVCVYLSLLTQCVSIAIYPRLIFHMLRVHITLWFSHLNRICIVAPTTRRSFLTSNKHSQY